MFQSTQLEALKDQISAYRYLSTNQPLPPALRSRLLSTSHGSSNNTAMTPATVAASAGQLANTIQGSGAPTPAAETLTRASVALASDGTTGASLPAKIVHATLTTQPKGSTPLNDTHKWLMPHPLPLGLDPLSVYKERERLIQARISYRLQELENTLTAPLSANQKLKAVIELKSLRLLSKQKQIREQVLYAAKKGTQLETSVDRASYRRLKKQSLKEARQTEKWERQQRADRHRRERERHSDYLSTLLSHGRELIHTHKQHQQRQRQVCKAVNSFHAQMEREELKREERMAKERLKALKADDEEAYLKLLDQQKDSRVMHLLKQTDAYLEQLTAAVQRQQEEGQVKSNQLDESNVSLPPAVVEEEEEWLARDYYRTAHRIRESITQQPSTLVGGQLKEYQIKGLEWMVSLVNNKLNGILADEMGLGKTIQTIALLAHLIEKKQMQGPFLVIVPLSTMTSWSLEFTKWAPSIIKMDYKGPPATRKALQHQLKTNPFHVLITTYEYIIKDKAFLSKFKWIHTIIDEGHRMKNASSKLSLTLSQFYQTRYRLILTGTPLQNNLPELWALLNFVLPRIFSSCSTFDEWFNAPFANTGEKVELNEEETLLIIRRLHKVLRPFLLRRLKKDVESELPDKVERVIKCAMSGLQKKLYSLVLEQMNDSNASNGNPSNQKSSVMKHYNNTVMQLRKIVNHPFVFEEIESLFAKRDPIDETLLHYDENLIRASGKFELLSRILPKFFVTQHRVLLFFQMTAVMDLAEAFFQHYQWKYLRLDGATKSDERSQLLAEFNAKESDCFLFMLSTRAGGLGLNLQTADTVILFDSDWNPHQDLQAQDRAHRIGQTREVRILRLCTVDSVEEWILSRAREKLAMDSKIIQAGRFDHRSTNAEREMLLRQLLDREMKQNSGAANEEDNVAQGEMLNELLARNEQEFELFQKMDLNDKNSPGLLREEELPLALRQGKTAVMTEQKERKRVNYSDQVDDNEFLMSDQEDTEMETEKEKEKNTDIKETLNQGIKLLMECTNELNLPCAPLFMKLPSRQLYPDYYQVIAHPIALNVITKRIKQNDYTTLAAFEKDVLLMFDNAMTFNQEESRPYLDALVMKEKFMDWIKNYK